MYCNQSEALDFLGENDVKFVRLAFCDMRGRQKNVSVPPAEVENAFTRGVSIDASAIEGFGQENESDLFLYPDPSTVTLLPWRPSHGRVARFFCRVCTPDGEPFACDNRTILSGAIAAARRAGVRINVGLECEFYLFRADEEGNMTDQPYDQAGYMDVGPDDRGENVRRDICLTLEEMGIFVEGSHHECGPGQNEVDLRVSDPMTAADNFVTFKGAVATIAAKYGLAASFSPKPIAGAPGNGLHVNLSVQPLAEAAPDRALTEAFMAGVMAHIRALTAFLNPEEASYRRFGAYKAPRYVTRSACNRSALVRIPAADPSRVRFELRSPDPAMNPYVGLALLIHAGLDGIAQKLTPPEPVEANLFSADPSLLASLPALPGDFVEAAALARADALVNRVLPEPVLEACLRAHTGRVW